MKTTINYLFISFSLIVFSTLFVSCDEDGDNTSPVIQLNTPQEGDVLKAGSTLNLDVVFTDNEMLKTYRVNMHSNFNNHGHSRAAGHEDEVTLFERTWSISGTKQEVRHNELQIPADAIPGKYHLVVECTDAASNEARVFRNVVVR